MDGCGAIIDKYVLVGVFIYFLRANFKIEEYSTRNFFIAVYVCHEIYEEVNALKFQIIKTCLGPCVMRSTCVRKFDEDRVNFLQRIDFHVLYDEEQCDLIFSKFPHVIWYRERSDKHSGVIFDENMICDSCCFPVASLLKILK
ncbi:hypothetical protein HHI36_000857 [Cryptolaemus montrouzieri]|uniref:Uncharacterized protein n=1 Tax=Cryptolaemus montrouzieri TaxID=559131 RepID=A0ABD2P5Z4_9CUCU